MNLFCGIKKEHGTEYFFTNNNAHNSFSRKVILQEAKSNKLHKWELTEFQIKMV